jgi:hypothetical protein
MKKDFEEIIPHQEEGMQNNTESDAEFSDEKKAQDFYLIARDRLLQINQWHELSGESSAEFSLTDENGNKVNRLPRNGDYFRIDIPGPGSPNGEDDDWVRIEAIEENKDVNDQWTAIRVRPAPSPVNEDKDVAHFFSDTATSTFIVRRENNKVIAGVYGRNEKPNMKADDFKDKVRNAAIALGAMVGISKIQWKNLVKGIVKK